MALQKEVTLSNGVVANYWRIDRITDIDKKSGMMEVVVALYKDAETAQIGGDSLMSKTWSGIPFTPPDDPYTVGYTALKAQPDYDGAVDV